MPAQNPKRAGLSATTNLLALLCFGLLAYFTSEIQQRDNAAAAQERLDEMVARVAQRIAERVTLYDYGLHGMAASVNAVGASEFSHAHFLRYSRSRDIAAEFPGARGFGIITRVPGEATARFIADKRQDGRPSFTLREITPHADDRWIIELIHPAAANQGAEGLDIASESNRSAAAERAVASGLTTLTQPITLVQAGGKTGSGFLLMKPVYRGIEAPASEIERRARAIHLTYCPLVIDEVLSRVDLYGAEIELALDSLLPNGTPSRFFATPSYTQSTTGIHTQRTIDLFGVQWQLTAYPRPALIERLNHFEPLRAGTVTFASLAVLLLLTNLYLLARARRLELFEDQTKLAAIVESSNDAIIGKTTDGVVISWNRAAEQMFGYTANEAIGHTIANLIVPQDLQDEEKGILSRLRRGERITNIVTRRHRKDGHELEVSVSVSPIFNADGQIIGASKTIHDVTEQQIAARQIHELNATLEQRVAKRTEQLEEARNTLHTVLDAMPSLVAYWDKDGINRFANRAYQDWFGVSPDSLYGKPICDLLGDEIYQLNLPHMQAALRGEPQTFERQLPRPGGGTRHAIAHYLPNAVNGSVEGFYAIVHDVTELIDGRNQLQEAREQQLRLDRLASLGLMVAGVAHELNTPLGAAMLALNKIEEELEQFRSATTVGLRKSDLDRLTSHLDSGLAMASRYLTRSAEIIRQFKQVASDRAGAERRRFRINDVIHDVLHLMESEIRKHGSQVVQVLETEVELDSYPGTIGQILQNLVQNALIHAFPAGSPGQVRITLHPEAGSDEVQIIVADNGTGIPEAMREKIWDPFFTTRRGEGGTGLGLHIVQRLATELLGGTVEHRNLTPGPGSEFVVTLPRVAPAAPATPNP